MIHIQFQQHNPIPTENASNECQTPLNSNLPKQTKEMKHRPTRSTVVWNHLFSHLCALLFAFLFGRQQMTIMVRLGKSKYYFFLGCRWRRKEDFEPNRNQVQQNIQEESRLQRMHLLVLLLHYKNIIQFWSTCGISSHFSLKMVRIYYLGQKSKNHTCNARMNFDPELWPTAARRLHYTFIVKMNLTLKHAHLSSWHHEKERPWF